MKPKPNLAAVLDDLPSDEPPKPQRKSVDAPGTVLVGANLSPRYARNLALLHAETGLSKKQLVQEALDMLFIAKGGPSLRL